MSENNIEQVCCEEEGLTFSKIFCFLGKAMPRILIYAAIALVISGIVCGILFFTSKTTYVSTIVDQSYEGIEDGLTPTDAEFNAKDMVAPAILNTALQNKGITDIDVGSLQNELSIDSVIPSDVLDALNLARENAQTPEALAALADYDYKPTRFVITINNCNKLNLTSAEAISLLNEIVDQYKKAFKAKYSNLSLNVATDVADYSKIGTAEYTLGYIETIDLLQNELDEAINFLNSLDAKTAMYRNSENGMSFADVLSKLKTLNDISLINLYNTSIKTKVAKSSLSYLNAQLESVILDEANYSALKANQQALVDSYKNTVAIVTDNGAVTEVDIATEVYDNMLKTLTSYNNSLAQATKKKAIITNRIAALNDGVATEATADDIANVNAQVKVVASAIDELVVTAEAMVNDFNANYTLVNSVTNIGAKEISINIFSLSKALVVMVISAVLAAGLAIIVELIKQRNKKAVENKSANQTNAVS